MRNRQELDVRRRGRSAQTRRAGLFCASVSVAITAPRTSNRGNDTESRKTGVLLDLLNGAKTAIEILEHERQRDAEGTTQQKSKDPVPFVRRAEPADGRQRFIDD